MTQEYTPTLREELPEGMEYKSTTAALPGTSPARVPDPVRTGSGLDDDERTDSMVVPGTFAAGNGVENQEARTASERPKKDRDSGASRAGLASDSGGSVTSRGGGRGAAKTATARSTARSGGTQASGDGSKTATGPSTNPGATAEQSGS